MFYTLLEYSYKGKERKKEAQERKTLKFTVSYSANGEFIFKEGDSLTLTYLYLVLYLFTNKIRYLSVFLTTRCPGYLTCTLTNSNKSISPPTNRPGSCT